MIVHVLNQLAQVIGWLIISVIGLAVLGYFVVIIYSYLAWSVSSEEAKQIGAAMQSEHGYDSGFSAMIADMVLESIDDLSYDAHINYEPSPVAQLDWSIDSPPATDLNLLKTQLTDAGFYVHPFPREREGDWSDANAGVWRHEPEWFVESEDGERITVNPDTHEWSVIQNAK